MSWTNWFRRRPLLQAEIEETSKDNESHTGASSPSAPLTTVLDHTKAQEASSQAASLLGSSLHAAEKAAHKIDIQHQGLDNVEAEPTAISNTGVIGTDLSELDAVSGSVAEIEPSLMQGLDSVEAEPTAITDTAVIGTDLSELDAVSGRVAEIEASAETVEEALAVAHTVFSETCGVVADTENGVMSSSCEASEPLSSNSGARTGPREERASLHCDVQETTVSATLIHDHAPCQALVPSSASEDDHKNFVCLVDLDALDAHRLDMIGQAVGPGLPSLEELLSCTQPHDILGVGMDADKESLKKAYRDRARAFHPDKHRTDNRDVDRAFTQAFMLITRAYMTLVSGDAQPARLQILNKVDLRRDRPVIGWALQQKYDEKKRERLSRAEKVLLDARKEVASTQQACANCEDQTTSKESRALQRRLTRAKLALANAEAKVQAESELYQIEQQKDHERVMKRLQKVERANSQKQIPKKRSRECQATDIIEEAARLEAQAEEMRKRAASLRAQAQGEGADSVQGTRSGKRRLVIQGCSSGRSSAHRE